MTSGLTDAQAAHRSACQSHGCRGILPADRATSYNPALAIRAKARTVALIEDTDLYPTADWTTLRSDPLGSGSRVHPSSDTNDCTDPRHNDIEAMLRVEWASAAAPRAAIQLASCSGNWTNFGGRMLSRTF